MRVRVSPGPPIYAPLAERFTQQPQKLWPSGIWVQIPGGAPCAGTQSGGAAGLQIPRWGCRRPPGPPRRRRKPSYGLAAARSKREGSSGPLGSRPSVSAIRISTRKNTRERRFLARRHSGTFFGELAKRELTPLG